MTEAVENARPSKTGVVALAVLVVLLLAAAGTFGVLYLKTRSDLAEQVARHDREVAELTKKQQDAYGQMLSAQAVKRDAETNAAMFKWCQEAAKAFTHESYPGNEAKAKAAEREVFVRCW